jgi:ABC-type multidrug transport system, ATPase and permease components
LERKACIACAGAAAAADCGRARLHANGAPAISITAARASNINALLHDNLAGVRQIKSFAREREEHARFNRASDQLRHATLVVMRTWAIYSPSMSMFEAIGALLVLGFGSHDVLTGSLHWAIWSES